MKIIINSINEAEINVFLKDHKHGNIFHTAELFEVYKNTKNYEPIFLLAYNQEEKLLGLLLAVVQKEYSGVLGNISARSIIWGGPLVKDNNLNLIDLLLKEYNKVVKRKAIYTQIRNLWEWNTEEKNIFKINGYSFDEHLDIIHNLELPPEEQFGKFNQGRRKNIRRAIKQDVAFEEIDSKDELLIALDLLKNTYKKAKLPIPDDSYFLETYNKLYSKKLVKFFKATYQKKIIGVRFVYCFKNLIYDWFAGSSDDSLNKYPNDFLPWKIMEWGHNNGYKTFDFGGAGKPNEDYGVRNYKLKFGGELVNWGRFEHVHKPIILLVSKLGFYFYQKIKYVR